MAFAKRLIQIRQEHPILRRRKFFQGRRIHGTDVKDIMWLHYDGEEMTDEDWESSWERCIGMFLAGQAHDEMDEKGEPVVDDTLLLILNSDHETVAFTVPPSLRDGQWEVLVDTRQPEMSPERPRMVSASEPLEIAGRSLLLLRLPKT